MSDADEGSPDGEPNPQADDSPPSKDGPHPGSNEGGARWWEGAAVTQLEASVQREAVELAVMVDVRLHHIIPNALPPLDSIVQWMESHLRGELLEEDEQAIGSAIAHFIANTPLP